jgi:hypothetical protein
MNCVGRTALVAVAMMMVPAAWSAGHKQLSEAQQRYQQQRAACVRGQSHQDRTTCLKEAAAAYQEARRGHLGNRGNFAQNATSRCDAQPEGERQACIQRILGAGSAEGSVEGGGILRRSESASQ